MAARWKLPRHSIVSGFITFQMNSDQWQLSKSEQSNSRGTLVIAGGCHFQFSSKLPKDLNGSGSSPLPRWDGSRTGKMHKLKSDTGQAINEPIWSTFYS